MAPGYLIGVGQDATDAGRRLGTMLQVFDVRDPYNPIQTSKLRIGGASEAEYDHHAFLWWPQSSDAFVPNQNYDQKTGRPFSGLVVANVTPAKITERGRIQHELEVRPGEPWPVGASPVTLAPTTLPPNTTPGAIPPPTIPRPELVQDQVRRALIVNGRLVTVGNSSVKVSELATLTPMLFTRF